MHFPWKNRRAARVAGQVVAAALMAGLAFCADERIAARLFSSRRRGYLPVIGTPPLRFQEDTSPATHPAQPAPIASSDSGPPDPPAGLPDYATQPGPGEGGKPQPPPPSGSADSAAAMTPGSNAAKSTPRLLWDVTKPAVTAEDFLPFFRMPGAPEHAPEALIVLPPPTAAETLRTPPPSSATYRQTP